MSQYVHLDGCPPEIDPEIANEGLEDVYAAEDDPFVEETQPELTADDASPWSPESAASSRLTQQTTSTASSLNTEVTVPDQSPLIGANMQQDHKGVSAALSNRPAQGWPRWLMFTVQSMQHEQPTFTDSPADPGFLHQFGIDLTSIGPSDKQGHPIDWLPPAGEAMHPGHTDFMWDLESFLAN